ncbi:MAG: primary-amine oxidase [Actinomycetota bacterium]|nr:primary-amine oxidase [Actinomycetota bacterium]
MAQVSEPTEVREATHPLEPPSPDELVAACELLRSAQSLGDDVRISSAGLAEPPKETLRSFTPGDAIDRRVKIITYQRHTRAVHEAIVSLTRGEVDEWKPVDGVQPPLMLEEYLALADQVKADPRYQEAMAKRGVFDLEHIQTDPWPAGWFGSELDATGRRLCRAMSFVRSAPDDNGYAYPVENLVAFVDYDTGEIVELVDDGVVPIPPTSGRYDAATIGETTTLREQAPLEITQPDGPGFTLDGNLLSWQNWRMRVSVVPYEGLVLHEIGWDDGTRVRPILHRAALAEMVVPYGSTMTNHWWKNAFDAGEIGLGKLLNSLTLGCDCKGEITYMDAHLTDEDGGAMTVENAVCIHEEDFGLLWKHWDFVSDTTESRRSRRLVVSSIATVGNYEYAFYWYFYLDGTIEHEVKMTGIVQTQAVPPGETAEQAVMIAPQLAAPHHQHLFCYRLDFDVDGEANTVTEVDVVALPDGDDNPFHNAFDTVRTPLTSEQRARRDTDPGRSRTWVIANPSVRNGVGEPVAYKLIPGYTPTMLAGEQSAIRKRATFATHNLWVTPYDPDEIHAAGDYPYQHAGGDGLPRWTEADRPTTDTDVVVWHTFGATHISRPEDWPIMPVERVGFTLKPYGFFDRNPSLDLAPEPGHCHD